MKARSGIGAAVAAILACACLAGCGATAYQDRGWSGGFEERQISANTWQLSFAGNGYTSYETVQTYWLYRAAEFTLQKGYDGFSVGASLRLTSFAPQTATGLVKIQVYSPAPDDKPGLSGTITLLKRPFKAGPPHVFDAVALHARLEPLVKSLCGSNVCPHFHDYLMPSLAPAERRRGEI
jgi:hypothetical protein